MFMLGMEYNQTHHILPFIAIGIGIDDMFVIMECWYTYWNRTRAFLCQRGQVTIFNFF